MRSDRSRPRFSSAALLVAGLGLAGCPEADPVVGDDVELSPDSKAPNGPRIADVDVDVTHDGLIGAADEAVEDNTVATFLANVDDDDGNGARDRQDLREGDDDLTDIVIRQVSGLGTAKLVVSVSPAIAQQRTRLWQGENVIADSILNEGVVEDIGDADVTLKLEALTGRASDWDGRMTITVRLVDGDKTISEDQVKLRAAAVIFPDNLQKPHRLFVMNVPDGQDNNVALLGAFEDRPDDVELYTTRANSYFFDRWMQDNWEVGSQTVPKAGGGVKEMITALQLERDYGGQGLDAFVPDEWMGPNRGFLYPGGSETSHNYGGNLEVAPPTADFPFGRMIYGGGDTTLTGRRNPDTMNSNQVSFLNAQEIQGPALEVSSEWLAVGHIDEIFQFVPDLEPEGDRGFKVVIASPALARQVLLDLQAEGQGDALAFPSRRDRYSVDEMLAAEEFMALNEAAQNRIDEVQADLMRGLGLKEDDFRRVPVLVYEIDSTLVAAFNPGIQNLVTTGDRVFAPDPEGPRVGGVDRWQQATLEALADTELDVIFVDVFESYHELLGEAHCGTNLEREPYATAWWKVEE